MAERRVHQGRELKKTKRCFFGGEAGGGEFWFL